MDGYERNPLRPVFLWTSKWNCHHSETSGMMTKSSGLSASFSREGPIEKMPIEVTLLRGFFRLLVLLSALPFHSVLRLFLVCGLILVLSF